MNLNPLFFYLRIQWFPQNCDLKGKTTIVDALEAEYIYEMALTRICCYPYDTSWDRANLDTSSKSFDILSQ